MHIFLIYTIWGKNMIFFPLGKKYDSFPKNGYSYFSVIYYYIGILFSFPFFLFPSFIFPFFPFPLFPSLFLFLLQACNNFFPLTPQKLILLPFNSYFLGSSNMVNGEKLYPKSTVQCPLKVHVCMLFYH